jgi:hypothetical protein
MAFGILTYCFAQRFYYLLCYFLPLLDFQCQLASFNSTLIYVFGKLWRLGFLECLKVSLVHQQIFLLIFRSVIGLVFVEVIALTMTHSQLLKGLKCEPKYKTAEEGGVGARSLAHNTLRGRGACWSSEMRLGELTTFTHSHWPTHNPHKVVSA